MRNSLLVACAAIGLAVGAWAPSTHAVVNYGDGATHNESGPSAEQFTISNGSTVHFLGSGSATPPTSAVGQDTIAASGGSEVTLSGTYAVNATSLSGTTRGVFLTDSNFGGTGGSIHASGGNAVALLSYGSGNITLNNVSLDGSLYDAGAHVYSAGSYAYGLAATGSATMTINSGVIAGTGTRGTVSTYGTFAAGIVAFGSTTTIINGGTISATGDDYAYAVSTSAQSVVEIHGGNLSFSSGTYGHHLAAYDNSIIRVYGSDFKVNGSDVPFGNVSLSNGFLSGVLQDGTAFGYDYQRAGAATVELVNAVPEPSSLALAGLGLCIPMFRRRGRVDVA